MNLHNVRLSMRIGFVLYVTTCSALAAVSS